MNGLSTEQWRDDLHFLSRELRDRRPSFFHTLSDRTFDRAIDAIDQALPHLPAHGIAAAFSELVSMIALRDLPNRRAALIVAKTSRLLPMRLHEFPEGLMVTQAPAHHRQLRGARLLAIDGTAIDTITATLHPLVSRDDLTSPDPTLPLHLIASETLHGLGLIGRPHRVRVSVEMPDGRRRNVPMNAMAAPFYRRWTGPRLLGLPQRPGVTYLSRPREALWFSQLEDRQALFIQINRLPTVTEMQMAIAVLTGRGVLSRAHDVIVDLRLCQNENPQHYEPLLKALANNRQGDLYVTTRRQRAPRRTDLTDALVRLGALVVAEPSIQFGEHYSEAMPVLLPNSGIALHLTRLTWSPDPAKARHVRQPDIPLITTAADFFADIDPALAAIERYRQAEDYSEALQTA